MTKAQFEKLNKYDLLTIEEKRWGGEGEVNIVYFDSDRMRIHPTNDTAAIINGEMVSLSDVRKTTSEDIDAKERSLIMAVSSIISGYRKQLKDQGE